MVNFFTSQELLYLISRYNLTLCLSIFKKKYFFFKRERLKIYHLPFTAMLSVIIRLVSILDDLELLQTAV